MSRIRAFLLAQVHQAWRSPVTLALVALIWVLGAVTRSLGRRPVGRRRRR
ncbi:MAG: hypothetical protein U0R72_19375 [Nakamurella multipartita]